MHSHGANGAAAAAGHPILIVDDNRTVTAALAKIIGRAGYKTVACHNGAEAMAFAARQTPAAAVVDIHLPDVNGLVLSSQLRERFGPDTPIIICSGDTSMETLNSLPHVGATYFISKPVNTQHLLERLKDLVA